MTSLISSSTITSQNSALQQPSHISTGPYDSSSSVLPTNMQDLTKQKSLDGEDNEYPDYMVPPSSSSTSSTSSSTSAPNKAPEPLFKKPTPPLKFTLNSFSSSLTSNNGTFSLGKRHVSEITTPIKTSVIATTIETLENSLKSHKKICDSLLAEVTLRNAEIEKIKKLIEYYQETLSSYKNS